MIITHAFTARNAHIVVVAIVTTKNVESMEIIRYVRGE